MHTYTSHDFYADLVNNDIDVDKYKTRQIDTVHILTITGTYNDYKVNIRIEHTDNVGAIGGSCSIITNGNTHVHDLGPKCDNTLAEYSVCTPTDVISEITAFLSVKTGE